MSLEEISWDWEEFFTSQYVLFIYLVQRELNCETAPQAENYK